MTSMRPPFRGLLPVAVLVCALAITAVSALALSQATPGPPSGATRVERFPVNLDGSRGLERIFVFNLSQGGQPTTYLNVWYQRADRSWSQSQYSRVYGPSPGSQVSGLEYAIVGDLNNDRRYEVAVLDYVTPSVGEVLSVLRQSRYHGLRFKPLQSISGDTIRRGASMPGSPTTFSVTIKANHSPDGRVHNERWAWSKPKQRWVCVSGPEVCIAR